MTHGRYAESGRPCGDGGPVRRGDPTAGPGTGPGTGTCGRSTDLELCTEDGIRGTRVLLEELSALAGLSPAVLSPVVKTVGISILTRISAELCRDAGEGGIASFVETAGAALALCVSVPLLRAVLNALNGLF